MATTLGQPNSRKVEALGEGCPVLLRIVRPHHAWGVEAVLAYGVARLLCSILGLPWLVCIGGLFENSLRPIGTRISEAFQPCIDAFRAHLDDASQRIGGLG